MNNNTLLNLINTTPDYAIEALKTVYHNRVYVVWTPFANSIRKFCKTRKSAESYINKSQSNRYYDEYSHEMVTCGDGLEVVEIGEFQIADPLSNKKMWYFALKSCLSVPHFADNVVYTAKRYGVETELLQWIEENATEVKTNQGLTYIEEFEVEVSENVIIESVEVAEEIAEVITNEVVETKNNDVTIVMNEELNGIEIHFTDKPEQTVIDSLKSHGFRWSKRGFWYAKQSNNTITFANGLNGTQEQQESSNNAEATTETKEASYPEIEINDLDNYTVSDELQRRLHANSMFTVDYKKDCVDTFQSIQNEALEVIASTDNKRITHYIKKYLQSYKKRYYEQYIKILNHKSNNPSWVITGRGGLNVRRYAKMQDRYDKYIGESVSLSKEFKSKMNGFRDEIRKDKDAAFRNSMNADLSTTELKDVFTVEKKPVTVAGHTETVRTYNYNGYTIAKSWGMFRIFKSGKEVKTTLKTTDTLDTAKRYVIMLVNQENAKAI